MNNFFMYSFMIIIYNHLLLFGKDILVSII